MKQIIRSLFMQFLFWILFFGLGRLVFLLYHLPIVRAGNASATELLLVFPHALRLDLATACYFMMIPSLILMVQSLWSPMWLNYINKGYAALMVASYSLTVTGEMGIYSEWQTKLSYKALRYLVHPSEVYNSAETGPFFFLIGAFLVLASVSWFAYHRWFYRNIAGVGRNFGFTAVFSVLLPGFLFLGARGGWQQIPINQSESYFSKQEILNHAAVNNAFNLYVSIFENYRLIEKNPYVFMDQEKAERMVRAIYRIEKDTTIRLLTADRPNIILFILESYSADLIESLGGRPGITPEFRKLEKEGVLFTQLYTSGMRSEQGMASLFAGFPSHPVSASVIQPEKYHALPSMPGVLKRNGYKTEFYFGGQLIYGNIKGYIYYNGFDKVMEGSDFPDRIPRGKLGIHDGYLFDQLTDRIGSSGEPFFASIFTLSSHSPYDQPFEKPLDWGGAENDYINSAYYTDHCLGEFFRKIKDKPWYRNTLFILVADHSHSSYNNWIPAQKEYRRIPMLLLGDVVRPEYRGTTWDRLANQHDLPATLLSQLGIPHDEFTWSRNLLNPYSPQFAYFSNENGYGWIRPGIELSYDLGKSWHYSYTLPPEIKDSIMAEAQAYLQVVFSRYLAQ